MSVSDDRKIEQRPRKPLWPWLLLLILTICAIYSYNRTAEIFRDIERNMPAAVMDLFYDLLQGGERPGQRGIEVEVTPPPTL